MPDETRQGFIALASRQTLYCHETCFVDVANGDHRKRPRHEWRKCVGAILVNAEVSGQPPSATPADTKKL